MRNLAGFLKASFANKVEIKGPCFAAAERPYIPLILVRRELKLGQFRQIGWCKNSGGAAGGGGLEGGVVQLY